MTRLRSLAAGTVRRLRSRPGRARQLESEVGLAGSELLEAARTVDPGRDDDRVEMVPAVAVVVGIPPETSCWRGVYEAM